ncbi:MAG: hypothetical protein JO062_05845 [Bryobacterales bacterium]|nr:hypothetical protein [Bryobacterales bacterium]
MRAKVKLISLCVAGAACVVYAQNPGGSPSPARDGGVQPTTADLQLVLQRLDRLEAQNQELMSEIRALREQLGSSGAAAGAAQTAEPPPQLRVQEQIETSRNQIAQLDQEKISTDHKLPLTLTGMLLFNGFWTGQNGGGADNPTVARNPSTPPASSGGGMFRQSVVGVKFEGPEIPGGGRITGSAYIDFFGGTGVTLNQLLRLRVASIDANWKTTTLTFALDKPIIAPREPDSLAQVGVSPLTSAGNLWLWQPQVRIEQRVGFGDQAGLRGQFGVYQTSEGGIGTVPSEYAASVAKNRPGYQGRFELWAQPSESSRIEIAPAFHASDSRVGPYSVPSRIFSIDWLIRPFSRIDLTGTYFHGENVGVVGGLRQGVSFIADVPRPVAASGGWAQLKIRVTPRVTFNFYGGQEDDRNSDLQSGAIAKNQTYAGNIMYRLGSNVLASFETSRTRTTYLNSGTLTFPHYDLGLAYLF